MQQKSPSLVALTVVTFSSMLACERPTEEEAPAAAATAATAAVAEPGGPDPKHGEYGLKVQFVRGQLEKKRCDKKTALELTKWLNKAGDFEGTAAHVSAFEQECGAWHRLLWAAAYAHEQAGKWDEAAAVDTRLIEDDPADSDFWWWRGRAHAEAGKRAFAEADFRQSMANKANGFSAFRFSKYLGDEKPCEAAFAVQWYMEHAKKVDDWAADKRSEHYVTGGCDKLEGKGAHRIKKKPNAPVVELTVSVAALKGQKMLLNESAAWLTLSRAAASKAGISATEDITPVYLYGKHLPAKVAVANVVTVGKAKAIEVPVAVVEEMPGGHAGVLGQSFLWRFRTEDTGTSYMIRAR